MPDNKREQAKCYTRGVIVYGRFIYRQKKLRADQRDPEISEKQLVCCYPIEPLFFNHLQLLLFQGLEVLFQLRSDFDDVLITRIFRIDNI